MFRIASENELLESFRPLDRGEVQLPESFHYPMTVRDYLTWTEPSGHRVYLLFSNRLTNAPLGIVFQRDPSAGGAAAMCEWCHSVRAGNGVTLLTAAASAQRRVGIPLCRDLSCKEKAEAAPGPDDVPQVAQGRERIRRIVERMADFARQNLF
jgi:hypothetical protein